MLEANGETYVEFKVDPSNIFDIGNGHHIKHLYANVQDYISIKDFFGPTPNPLRYNTWGFDITGDVSVGSGLREIPNQGGSGTTTEQTMGALSVSQASSITGNLAIHGETPIASAQDFPLLTIQNAGVNNYYNAYLKVNGHFQLENAGLALINSGSRDSLLDISGRALITDSLIGVGVNDLSKANLTNHTILTANQGIYVGEFTGDTNGNNFPDPGEIDSTNDTTKVMGALNVDLIDLLQESQVFKDKNLDLYANFKKPIQITEITIPAYSWERDDEEVQAELIEKLYSIWFSHPNVEQIIYWNLVDGYAYLANPDPEKIKASRGDMTIGENYYHAGLFRFDLSPKPAYYKLRELTQKVWHTETKGKPSFLAGNSVLG